MLPVFVREYLCVVVVFAADVAFWPCASNMQLCQSCSIKEWKAAHGARW